MAKAEKNWNPKGVAAEALPGGWFAVRKPATDVARDAARSEAGRLRGKLEGVTSELAGEARGNRQGQPVQARLDALEARVDKLSEAVRSLIDMLIAERAGR